jgi:kynurenine formamidase
MSVDARAMGVEVMQNGARWFSMVDLSHPLSFHTPGWVGYPGMKQYYTQTLQTNRVVSQRVETSLHVGTHIDAPLHLTPHHITDRIDVKRGDIVIYHTGFVAHYLGGEKEDLTTYMCRHPAGGRELAEWIVDMDLAWTGSDTGSADHPMNTTIKNMRPDIRAEYERTLDMSLEERWPDEDLFVMHRVPFPHDIIHAENVGGDLASIGTARCVIGAFPWKFIGGEASICRIIAFFE